VSTLDTTAVGQEILSILADGEWHELGELAEALRTLADEDLVRAIAVGCIAGLRDEGYCIEEDGDDYRCRRTRTAKSGNCGSEVRLATRSLDPWDP
jgi:hypothetical protein